MILTHGSKEVEITPSNWVLAEPLIVRKGYTVDKKATSIKVRNIDDLTSELSAWGIPWKRVKWDY